MTSSNQHSTLVSPPPVRADNLTAFKYACGMKKPNWAMSPFDLPDPRDERRRSSSVHFSIDPRTADSRQLRQIVSNLVPEATLTQASGEDEEEEEEEEEANKGAVVRVHSYSRMMHAHTRQQIDHMSSPKPHSLPNYQKSMHALTLDQIKLPHNSIVAHRRVSSGETGSLHIKAQQSILPSPVCVDLNQLTIDEAPVPPCNSPSPGERILIDERKGMRGRSTTQPVPRGTGHLSQAALIMAVPNREIYAVERDDFTDQSWNDSTNAISLHDSIAAAVTAAEEHTEEMAFFASYPQEVKRWSPFGNGRDGTHSHRLQYSNMEELRQESIVRVKKREERVMKGSKLRGQPNQRVLEKNRFSLCGELETLSRRAAEHAVELYGGRCVNTLSLADYAVVGRKACPDELEWLRKAGAETPDEQGFYSLLKQGVPKEKAMRDVRYEDGRGLVQVPEDEVGEVVELDEVVEVWDEAPVGLEEA
ncbi:Hypothetical predicted protein [Lecanosticta acicola]|uniref:BRCT domain-containing protein n=1 Tax=Lecanosticta acicola TaxID=111012 RepID=A0AAI8YSJ5_9PEZI|nr:Hypothetical predicted protein [Lecanosticta acicola]